MKVLHVGKFAPPYAGGVERYIQWLMPALRERGIKSLCLAHAHAGVSPGLRRVSGQPVVAAPVLAEVLYTPISLGFAARLDALIRRWQPDLLHLHVPNPACFWALLLPSARRLPWLLQWQSDVPADALDWRVRAAYRLYRPWEQALLQRSACIVAASPPYAESSFPLQAHRSRVRVIPLGIPEALPAAAAAATEWPTSAMRVLSVGRLTYYKGHEVLIDAAARCPSIQVAIVGDGERRGALQRRIDSLDIGARVRLLGAVDAATLAALYRDSDLFCLPSIERSEAFGLVLLEAMRAGKPVVTSAIPGSGTAWIVQHGETGETTLPGDVTALASTLQRLADQPETRQRYACAGQQRFLQSFTIKASALQLHQAYRSLL